MPITKPPVLTAWADAGDKVQPSGAELSVGWPVTSTPPSRQRFNWILNYLANAVRYFSRRGISDYDATETYMTGDCVIGDDGKTYRSLIDNNTAQTPSTQPTKWERWGFRLSELGSTAQTQATTAFTTAGAAPNFTLTPSPAIAAYAANQRFRAKFHVAGTGTDLVNVSGLGNKSLKQYDSTGTKVNAVVVANQLCDIEYDGVDFVVLDPLPISGQLIAVRVFTASGTYTPTTGTKSVVVEAVGGGGGGGGAAATGAAQYAIGVSGNGGSYGKARFTSGFSGVAMTIGAAGAAGASGANSGGNGGTTSFGALLSCPGGTGGAGGSVINSSGAWTIAPVSESSGPVGANILGVYGQSAQASWTSGGLGMRGASGGNPLFNGILQNGLSSGVQPGVTPPSGHYGVGGTGCFLVASQAAQPGAAGSGGLIIVSEYA